MMDTETFNKLYYIVNIYKDGMIKIPPEAVFGKDYYGIEQQKKEIIAKRFLEYVTQGKK